MSTTPPILASYDSADLLPGKYERRWGGYSVRVEVVRRPDGSLVEITHSGLESDPASMPGASWLLLPLSPVDSATANLHLPGPNQTKVVEALESVFGREGVRDRGERMKRFLEEAVELVRAGGLPDADVSTVVAYELSRPVGPDLAQEIGGAGVTLFALADAFNFDLNACAQAEISRVLANKDRCRAKHASKPSSVARIPGPTGQTARA